MKKNGILNSSISKVLSDMGHTDKLCIGDAGLPTPKDILKIDLAVKEGNPSFIDVLEEVLKDQYIEKIYLANEIKEMNKNILKRIYELITDVEVIFIPHEEFKLLTKETVAIIRTGEVTPYANIILESGVSF